MEKEKTILIIEDGVELQETFKRFMPKNINLLQAYTCLEAQEIIMHIEKENEDKETGNKEKIDIIAFDGNIKSEGTTLDLIKKISEKFSGVMIAMSNDDYLRKEQMEAGCNMELNDKSDLLKLISNL